MSKYYLGIDLGSTTSKAVIIDQDDNIIGRGITNTRANYEVAADIAKMEAIYNARFSLLKSRLAGEIARHPELEAFIRSLEDVFRFEQFLTRAMNLEEEMLNTADSWMESTEAEAARKIVTDTFRKVIPIIKKQFLDGKFRTQSQFFRDIIGEAYRHEIDENYPEQSDRLMVLFDKSITPVENKMITFDFRKLIDEGMDILDEQLRGIAEKVYEGESINWDAEMNLLKGNHQKIFESVREHIDYIAEHHIEIENMVGTGYGRALLPFPKDCIRSEILCHAFGAHAAFPNTRTVLDIGGQDTKAIQVNQDGLVTSFQMNDRCAAGCGRYLGYIADELNISLGQLGPMALEAEKEVNICSTCTVFAGAELRELINIGEKREDILSGLHRAIVMRAMSLLARSGGVRNELTFTGGVARNVAVLKFVKEFVYRNYGDDIIINVDPDSIFMGALGGAMFARRNINIDLPENQKKNVKATA